MATLLHHHPQTSNTGCLYASLYALTGFQEVLEHAPDVSDARFTVRLAELGLFAHPYWITPPEGPITEAGFWTVMRARFRALLPGEEAFPLLVAIAGTTPGWLHSVAVSVPLDHDQVEVSDSNAERLFSLPWSQFLASAYARAHRVEALAPLDLEAFPPDVR